MAVTSMADPTLPVTIVPTPRFNHLLCASRLAGSASQSSPAASREEHAVARQQRSSADRSERQARDELATRWTRARWFLPSALRAPATIGCPVRQSSWRGSSSVKSQHSPASSAAMASTTASSLGPVTDMAMRARADSHLRSGHDAQLQYIQGGRRRDDDCRGRERPRDLAGVSSEPLAAPEALRSEGAKAALSSRNGRIDRARTDSWNLAAPPPRGRDSAHWARTRPVPAYRPGYRSVSWKGVLPSKTPLTRSGHCDGSLSTARYPHARDQRV